jgi:hypothetical protein
MASSISSNNEYIVDKIRFRLQHDRLNFEQRKVKLMIINVFPVLLDVENVLKNIVIDQPLDHVHVFLILLRNRNRQHLP